jgi:hypothetical protein
VGASPGSGVVVPGVVVLGVVAPGVVVSGVGETVGSPVVAGGVGVVSGVGITGRSAGGVAGGSAGAQPASPIPAMSRVAKLATNRFIIGYLKLLGLKLNIAATGPSVPRFEESRGLLANDFLILPVAGETHPETDVPLAGRLGPHGPLGLLLGIEPLDGLEDNASLFRSSFSFPRGAYEFKLLRELGFNAHVLVGRGSLVEHANQILHFLVDLHRVLPVDHRDEQRGQRDHFGRLEGDRLDHVLLFAAGANRAGDGSLLNLARFAGANRHANFLGFTYCQVAEIPLFGQSLLRLTLLTLLARLAALRLAVLRLWIPLRASLALGLLPLSVLRLWIPLRASLALGLLPLSVLHGGGGELLVPLLAARLLRPVSHFAIRSTRLTRIGDDR